MLSEVSILNTASDSIKAIKEFNDNVGSILKTLKSLFNAITHPSILMAYIHSSAFIVCMIVVCIGVIAYAVGFKRANIWITASIAIFIIIEMLSSVI